MSLHGRKLLINQPLQPPVKQQFALMVNGKLRYCRIRRIPELLRPLSPDPKVRVARMKVLVKRAVDAVQPKQITLRRDPVPARCTGRARIEDPLQRSPFQRGYSLVLND